MLRFEVLQGQHGDCFVLRWADDGGTTRTAVIDGGPSGVYASSLRTRLVTLKGASPTLDLDWVMLSHIDDDHINGLLELTRELRNLKDQQQVAPFRIRRFWFNSFEDLAGESTTGAPNSLAELAELEAHLPTGQFSRETQAILASVGQGRKLRDAIEVLGLSGNEPTGELLQSGNPPVDLDGLRVTVVGPLQQQLKDLRNSWTKSARDGGVPAEVASYADISIPNLSSVVCFVAYEAPDHTRTLLLTGDARGDLILEGLECAGILPKEGKLKLDLLKVQHHGSDRDIVQEYFERLPADHYIISANGKYCNPDKDTLAWLVHARAADAYTIHISNEQPWMAEFFANLKQPGWRFDVVYRGPLHDNTTVHEINLD